MLYIERRIHIPHVDTESPDQTDQALPCPFTESLDILDYRIRPNYHTYPYKCTVKQFHSLQITASALFVINLYPQHMLL